MAYAARDRWRWIGLIMIVHVALTMGAILMSMSLAMSAFEGERESATSVRVFSWLSSMLMAPLPQIFRALAPRSVQAVPLIGSGVVALNSLLWATVLVWLLERRARRRAASDHS